MKKLKYAVILLLGLSMAIMTSCTKDPENGSNNGSGSYQTKIVGKWQPTKYVFRYYNTTGTLLEDNATLASHDDDDRFSVMQFNSDGTVLMGYSWIPKSTTAWTMYYKIEEHTLSYSFDDVYYENWSIIELTNSKMVWEKEGERDGYETAYQGEDGDWYYEFHDVGRVCWTERWEFEKVN